MDDLNFNVDDIINDVNAKIKSAEKNEADEESVEAEPIADTENSSEDCEQADNTDEKPNQNHGTRNSQLSDARLCPIGFHPAQRMHHAGEWMNEFAWSDTCRKPFAYRLVKPFPKEKHK